MATATAKSMVPIAILGAVTASMPTVPAAATEHRTADFGARALSGKPQSADIVRHLGPTPPNYTVAKDDSIERIAHKFGLDARTVAALNGLTQASSVHAGQTLSLTRSAQSPTDTPQTAEASSSYTVESGDTASGIAADHGVSTQALLDANGLTWSSTIYPGDTLTIPSNTSGSEGSGESKSDSSKSQDSTGGSYTVKSGDTVSGIAADHGVSIQALLDANDLNWSSIIYIGQKLVIPGSETPTESSKDAEKGTDEGVTPLTAEMTTNAQTIIRIGRSLGVSDYGLVIALAAAMQESSLRNVDHGDRDSVGLFQQRPSQGWGTADQLMDTEYASRVFFTGVTGKTLGLLDIDGWENMSVTEAAQAVQISAYPDAYARWETSARSWLKQLD